MRLTKLFVMLVFAPLITACATNDQPADARADAGPPPPQADAASEPPNPPDAGHGEKPDAGTDNPVVCDGLPGMAGDQVLTLRSGGRDRRYRLHVPRNYDPRVAMPLVLNFHGYTSNASQQEFYTGMSAKADAVGFIAVHPDGIGNSWNAGQCCGDARSQNIDDVQFVDDLLDQLLTMLCIDRARVYATGMSNGGFMSHRVACDLTARFAAIAPVAGHNVTTSCNPTRPIPVLHFHGNADDVVGYGSVPGAIAAWAQRNGCGSSPQTTLEDGNVTCVAYPSCAENAETVLCTIDGGGHTWPGSFNDSANIDATDAIWEFFDRHSL